MKACNEGFTYATKKLCKRFLIYISQRLNNLIWIRTTVLSFINATGQLSRFMLHTRLTTVHMYLGSDLLIDMEYQLPPLHNSAIVKASNKV